MENIKHSEQNIKVEITKKNRNSAHKRFLQKFKGNSERARQKFRVSFVCIHIA